MCSGRHSHARGNRYGAVIVAQRLLSNAAGLCWRAESVDSTGSAVVSYPWSRRRPFLSYLQAALRGSKEVCDTVRKRRHSCRSKRGSQPRDKLLCRETSAARWVCAPVTVCCLKATAAASGFGQCEPGVRSKNTVASEIPEFAPDEAPCAGGFVSCAADDHCH